MGNQNQKPNLLLKGMHGLGDNIHQRAIIRHLMPKYNVWLESSWVSVYWDLIADGLRVTKKATPLRTQSKNAAREDHKFVKRLPAMQQSLPVWYRPREVNLLGSVLAALCHGFQMDPTKADFTLPIQESWGIAIDEVIRKWKWKPQKPIMVYRPLVLRKEWGGCESRNPDYNHYRDLFEQIRKDFFVVSVADLVPREEWVVGHPVKVDIELHKGELPFELLAALFQRAALIFSSPGFAIPLAQSVGTPSVCVFGGFETGTSFSAGAGYGAHLAIAPINQCGCWKHDHACDKRIDMERAWQDLEGFVRNEVFTERVASVA